MIPIYGVEAYVALRHPHMSLLYAILRNFYESFVLLSFIQYLLTFLGGPVQLAKQLEEENKLKAAIDGPETWCSCKSKHWRGTQFVKYTLLGTLQYVPAMVIVVALMVVSSVTGHYFEGVFRYTP
jgi:hypothetical protein